MREDAYEGQYCVRSGAIGNNGTTTLILVHEAGSNDTISFYYKVSSENGWDKLHFFIDNQEKNDWSGSIGWTKASYLVSEGRHTYKWTYTKDGSQSSGSDCAWIDYVSLPAARVMAGTAGNDVTVCEGNDAQIVGYAIHYDNLQWTTSGDGTFDNASIATPMYTPGPQDIANHQATLTLTINGHDETITDEMTVFIVEKAVIENALSDVHYCAIDEPQPIAVRISGDYVPFQWLTDGDGTFEDAEALETTYTPGLNDINNGDEHSHFTFSYLVAYIESAKANRDVAAAKNILEEISLLNYDLNWKSRIPNSIKWYDRNFDNVEWSDSEYARRCVDQALELIGGSFTKDEAKEAFRRILNARESLEEIREAEGLLG